MILDLIIKIFTKLGWIDGQFDPYQGNLTMDSDYDGVDLTGDSWHKFNTPRKTCGHCGSTYDDKCECGFSD